MYQFQSLFQNLSYIVLSLIVKVSGPNFEEQKYMNLKIEDFFFTIIIACTVQKWFVLNSMLTIIFVMRAAYASLRKFNVQIQAVAAWEVVEDIQVFCFHGETWTYAKHWNALFKYIKIANCS